MSGSAWSLAFAAAFFAWLAFFAIPSWTRKKRPIQTIRLTPKGREWILAMMRENKDFAHDCAIEDERRRNEANS